MRLGALRAPLHTVELVPQTAYDPVKKLPRVRLPEPVAVETIQSGEAHLVVAHRLAPADPAVGGILEAPASPAEAPALADDVRLRVTFRLAAPASGLFLERVYYPGDNREGDPCRPRGRSGTRSARSGCGVPPSASS